MILTLIERTQCWIQTDSPHFLSQMPPSLLSSDIMDGDMDRMHLAKCNLCPHQFTFRGSGETAKHETAVYQNTNLPIVTKLNLISRSRSLWQFEIDIWGGKLLDARKAQLWFFDMNLFWGCFEYHKAALLSTGTFQFGIVFIWKGLKSETPHEHC